jgi:hypothetical protein
MPLHVDQQMTRQQQEKEDQRRTLPYPTPSGGGMRRSVIVAVVLAALASATPSLAAEPAGALKISGSRTSSIVVDFGRDFTLDVYAMTVTSRDGFSGFYLERATATERQGGRDTSGAVLLHDLHAPDDSAFPIPLSGGEDPNVKLGAGRYRVYFVGDRPGTVTVPIKGVASRTVKATALTDASANVEPLRVELMTHVQGRQPITVAPRSVSLSTLLVGRFRAHAGSIGACLTQPGGECDGGVDGDYTGVSFSPTSEYDFSWTVSYADGAKKGGRYDARQSATNAAGISFGLGGSFTLKLR